MKKKIAVLPGDGIGTEVADGAVRVLKAIAERYGHEFTFTEAAVGGDAIDRFGTPLPEETLNVCKQSDGILLGAVGGPKWDNLPSHERPERGLLGLRKSLGLFANIRPVQSFASTVQASPLKSEIVDGVDLIIVRELTGGLYFGKPSERRGERSEIVVDTLQYGREEIERIVEKGFALAQDRKKKLTSVDKANVLESSRMWREIVDEKAKQYPDVEVEHMLVDAAAMKLIHNPKHFDVIVTENMFGDILSDEASMLTGSLGMLPSASLASAGPALYEPVHGSAPDIAGHNKANPLAMILSAAMMLRLSFGMTEEADAIDRAVQEVLESGYHTEDVNTGSGCIVGTKRMVDQVIYQLEDDDAIAGILAAYA